MSGSVRVGTRRSPLATAQTRLVIRALQRRHPNVQFDVVPLETTGDRDLAPGASPDFTDTIDRALLRGTIDLAVHSAKDLPVEMPPGLRLSACPRRADPRDGLVVRVRRGSEVLPRSARVGSSSLRRRAQLLRWRPDLRVVELRGNVDSRIARVRAGQLDGAIVAVAGLRRLGRAAELATVLTVREFLPAPAQGALAIVTRSRDRRTAALAVAIDHPATHHAVVAERAFARALGGDCRLPLGALAKVDRRALRLTGEVLSADGRVRVRSTVRGPATDGERLGQRLGVTLRNAGGATLLAGASVPN